jgi:hypothetical protein
MRSLTDWEKDRTPRQNERGSQLRRHSDQEARLLANTVICNTFCMASQKALANVVGACMDSRPNIPPANSPMPENSRRIAPR